MCKIIFSKFRLTKLIEYRCASSQELISKNVRYYTDTTFADSTYSGGGTLGAMSIYVAGRYYVNGALTLNNCMVYVKAGGQITVQGGGNKWSIIAGWGSVKSGKQLFL